MLKTEYEILAMNHEDLAKWAAKLQADLFSNVEIVEGAEAKRIALAIDAEIERRKIRRKW